MNDYEVCYESDASGLKGTVKKVFNPKKAEEIQAIVKNTKTDIVPRGFGMSKVGGCIPNNSIIIDTRKLNNATNFNPKEGTVLAQAGISIKELNEKLNSAGFEFPIFSSDHATTSIGGAIALDSIGDRSMKYGTTKDWIEEIEFINGRGETVKLGKADMMDVCGMEGITGIITSAKLKISPLIKRSISIFQSEDIQEIISIAKRLKLEKEITMLKLYSKQVSELLEFPNQYHLIIEFNSDRGKIKGETYKEIIGKNETYALYSKDYIYSQDPQLFFDKIEEFISFLEQKNIPFTGDLGLGIIYPFFKDKHIEKEIFQFLEKTKVKYPKYGFGLKRKNLLEESEKKIIQRIKQRHDPFGKINKGKIIDLENKETIIELNKKEDINKDKKVILKKNIDSIYQQPSELSTKQLTKQITQQSQIPQSSSQLTHKQSPQPTSQLTPQQPINNSEKFDYSQIKDIMKNKFMGGAINTTKKEENITNQNKPQETPPQNKELPNPEKLNNSPKPDDKDLINRIMLNKFKKDEHRD